MNADNFGDNNEFILNSDLDTYNVLMRDFRSLERKLNKKISSAKKLRLLCFAFFSCHGMLFESTQHVVLNEFDPKKKFYKLYAAQEQIRFLSNRYKNCYFISVFACCREKWLPDKHTNCIGARSKDEAEQKIQQIALEEE